MDDANKEITTAMVEAGEMAILERVGGCDLGGHFSASRLAREVYLAMSELAPKQPVREHKVIG